MRLDSVTSGSIVGSNAPPDKRAYSSAMHSNSAVASETSTGAPSEWFMRYTSLVLIVREKSCSYSSHSANAPSSMASS